MDTRRSLLAAIGTSGLGLVSGCLKIARGEKLQYQASPAAVDPQVVEEEDFSVERTREPTVDRTIEPPVGGPRQVTVRNWVVQYAKSFSLSELGTAALLNNDFDPEQIKESVSEETLEEAGVDTEQLEDASEALQNGTVDTENVDAETLEEYGIDPSAIDTENIDAETLEKYGIDPEELEGNEKTNESGSTQGESSQEQSGTDTKEGSDSDQQRKGILFGVVSTPRAKVLGQDVNPAASFSNEELVEKVGDRFAEDKLEDLSLVEETTTTLLGGSETLSTFETEATIEGLTLDVQVHLTKAKHGDDLVIAAGAHPSAIDRKGSIERLLENVDHPAELPETGDN